MEGGAKAHLADLITKSSLQINIYVLIILSLLITFVKQIPIEIRSQAGSFLGRLFLFVATLATAEFYSWTNGLLTAVLALLLLSLSPRTTREGFLLAPTNSLRFVPNNKWFVEKVLKENPIAIEEEQVNTQAVQDNSNSSRSTSSSQGGSK
jgi:hypothetical protein